MPKRRYRGEKVDDGREVDSLWQSQPETIKRFINQRPDYEQLCIEVAYILRKRIATQSIDVALVTQRAKTLNSFLEKIERKKYESPFEKIEDFAGVRVVCLYVSDLDEIEAIIKAEFDILEKVDKFTDKAPDQFGYGAVHYIVRLGKKNLGARYDDLKDLKCEVQVRTVLQDAWAIIDHHLVYKRESDIPSQIQRKLNGLAGLLETADDQFDRVREERQDYLRTLEDSSGDEYAFLSSELNHDSFAAYAARQFPQLPSEAFDGQLNMGLSMVNRKSYPTLEAIHSAIEHLYPHLDQILSVVDLEADSGNARVILLLSVVDAEVRNSDAFPEHWKQPIEELSLKLDL
ncbi:hypothetical protein T9A_00473 [Alcanivorax jadensis T9]|uniref:RelA/SpoT domain-containing protein n=1 Tax=Alcanivorax jadensis T9 TaxID=1177181 RepID=A0ABR4WHS5_9GAMM|nr:hypothetical protein [Alcanivorax jadensis]KGD63153.1 hypothetical protein T9A_00473 [Alcanivorax jadensis T9]